MTKDELISFIKKMQSQRAFTYEDRMKLTILDSLPFTIWASDRDCIVRLWEGQCKSMYGYRKEEVLGKNYVDLFVAKDEQAAARRDQLEIIDNNATFHNIANDRGRFGNILRLITNCCRIIDPDNGDCLSAEMGVSIAYYEEEKQRLEENIAEGRRIQSFNKQFLSDQQQHKDQFQERFNSLWDSIRKGKTDAAINKRIEQYQEKIESIERGISKAKQEFDELLLTYKLKVSECVIYLDCESVKRDYLDAYNNFLNKFSELAIQLEIINAEFVNGDDLTAEKDEAMNATSRNNSRLVITAQNLYNTAEKNYSDYKSLGSIDDSSERLQRLTHDYEKAIRILSENKKAFDNPIYYYRDIFDLYVETKNINGMEETVDNLKKAVGKDSGFLPLLFRRECILLYFQTKDFALVNNKIITSTIISSKTKTKIRDYLKTLRL